MGNLVSEILRRRYGPACTKVVYPSAEAAEEIMRKAIIERGPKHFRSGKRRKQYPAPYYCQGCKGWHWGHAYTNPMPTSMRDFYEALSREGSSAMTSPRCEEA